MVEQTMPPLYASAIREGVPNTAFGRDRSDGSAMEVEGEAKAITEK